MCLSNNAKGGSAVKKQTKVWLVIAGFLILAGLIVHSVLHNGSYETNTYEITESFHNLSINTDTADITFALSEDGKCRVQCYEEEKVKHCVTIREDTLVIEVVNSKSWYDYIGINISSPKITVFLPKAQYDSFLIDVSTGNVRIGNLSVKELNISVSTGDVTLANLPCNNLTSTGSTGNVHLDHVTAAQKLSIERSTGNVKFDGCDAAEIFVETDTGNVTGSLLTEKIFFTHTDTGRIDVPQSVTGGKCEITTDTGNIKITIA